MPRLRDAQSALDAFETELRSTLTVPDGEDWQAYLPETGVGDRMFAKWQKLAATVRRAEEAGQ